MHTSWKFYHESVRRLEKARTRHKINKIFAVRVRACRRVRERKLPDHTATHLAVGAESWEGEDATQNRCVWLLHGLFAGKCGWRDEKKNRDGSRLAWVHDRTVRQPQNVFNCVANWSVWKLRREIVAGKSLTCFSQHPFLLTLSPKPPLVRIEVT